IREKLKERPTCSFPGPRVAVVERSQPARLRGSLRSTPAARQIQFPTGAASLRPEGLEIGSRRPDFSSVMTASPSSGRWLGSQPPKPARGRKLELVMGSPARPSNSTGQILRPPARLVKRHFCEKMSGRKTGLISCYFQITSDRCCRCYHRPPQFPDGRS